MRTALLLFCCVCAMNLDAAAPQPNDSQKIILTAPHDGDTLFVGDTVSIDWVCIDDVMYVDVYISPDAGKTWIRLNNESIPYNDAARWTHYQWRIPETIDSEGDEFTLADNSKCLFRAENYSPQDNSEISINKQTLTIRAASSVKRTNHRSPGYTPAFTVREMLKQYQSPVAGNAVIRFFDAQGKQIQSREGMPSRLIFGVLRDDNGALLNARKAASLR